METDNYLKQYQDYREKAMDRKQGIENLIRELPKLDFSIFHNQLPEIPISFLKDIKLSIRTNNSSLPSDGYTNTIELCFNTDRTYPRHGYIHRIRYDTLIDLKRSEIQDLFRETILKTIYQYYKHLALPPKENYPIPQEPYPYPYPKIQPYEQEIIRNLTPPKPVVIEGVFDKSMITD